MAKKNKKEGTESVAGVEAAGVGRVGHAQTTEEAVAAELARREGFSEAEKDEAETRDRVAKSLEARKSPEVPAVGSPDEEGREDANAADSKAKEDQRFGTGPNERTNP